MPKLLFPEFGSSNKDTWKKQAEKELKEKYKEASSREIAQDLFTDSYYTAEDIDNERTKKLQDCQKKIPGWQNIPIIQFDTPRTTNTVIKSSLKCGADAVILDLKENNLTQSELSKTLHAIKLSETPVYFCTKINTENLFEEISRGAGYYLKGGIFNDPLANHIRWESDFQEAIENICLTLNKTKMMREFRPLMIESHVYHNAGADAVQELGYLLASTVYYLDKLTDAGISPLYALNRFFFSVSIGPDYLTEIAKLRALRFLYRKISRAYQVPDELCQVFIHAQTSSFYNSSQSPHTNIIRSASEAMSAVTGGCDGLTVQAFDHSYSETSEFSERIARNVSALLANESYLDKVADPAAGSYQLEIMSQKIADAAWDLFLMTEEKGGFMRCFEEGYIQSEIEKSWQKKVQDLNSGKVMVGVNKFRSDPESVNLPQNAILKNDMPNFQTLPVRNLSEALLL
jgi:methylmalonyl-CoA mutase